MDFRIARYDQIGSTNAEIKRIIETGGPEGSVCRARVQTEGYGRQGRVWSSPEGGLYQSLLLRPNTPMAQLPTLALVVALAVREAALAESAAASSDIKVKWPNDVMACIDGQWGKLSGISCEVHAGGVCVGIGVNVLKTEDARELAGKNTAAYLADLGGRSDGDAIDRLGDAILETFAERYARWANEGFVSFADEYAACSYLDGMQVRIADRAGSVTAEGIARGVDADGRLLLRTAAGIIPISSGEAHLI